MSIVEIIGLIAPVLFLFAYAMISLGKWQAESLRFQLFNLTGAIAILISLTKDFNLAVCVLEVCWGLISVYGVVKALKARKRA